MVAKTIKKAYLVGIGGIGISALARYFLSEGWQVSGSDLSLSGTTKELQKEGVKIYIGHQAGHIRTNMPITKVIYNQAIPSSNIELRTAKLLGIPCQSYPQAVGELTRKCRTIAIAGAHGKSTTTALVSLILIAAGFDPTVIVGTKLREFGDKNFRKGKGDWLVLEADEWKASFLNYSPTLAVITNIDKEHLDFYKTFTNVKRSFQKFIKNILPDGTLFINGDHSNVLENIRMKPNTVLFSENDKAAVKIKKVLRIPGKHNVLNALAAYSVGRHLKIPEKIILKALSEYRGAWRRMEYRGELIKTKNQRPKTKIRVYDDYAHHPTEVKATLAGFREKWPKSAIICVFQAHQAQRLKLLFKDFKTAFKDADGVIILPTYEVAGRERKKTKNQKPKTNDGLGVKLAKAIGAIYIKNPTRDLKKVLESFIRSSHHSHKNSQFSHYVLVMIGAGDIVNLTSLLIK